MGGKGGVPMTIRMLLWAILFGVGTAGCAHQIAFEDITYTIPTEQHDAGLVLVIDPATLNRTVTTRSMMTGIAHSWNSEPGIMLKQVADVEFPQMFKYYEVVESYKEPTKGSKRLSLHLTVPHYVFQDFHAIIAVRAIAQGDGQVTLFDKTYREEGIGQGGKMFWAGAFGMKSAVRQSSFDAYKKIFQALRLDLETALMALKPE